MIKKRLGVNIDHVATIRNARGEIYPDPLRAALIAEKSGADSLTIHLREDRRHIRDNDLRKLKKKLPYYITSFPIKKSRISEAVADNQNNLKKLLKLSTLKFVLK